MYCLLCTLWYAVKVRQNCLKDANFLHDSKFRLLFTVILYVFKMFVTFTYLFFFVDVDLRSVCVWTLPCIRFALDGTRFSRMF